MEPSREINPASEKDQFIKPKFLTRVKSYLGHKIIAVIILIVILGGGFGIKYYFLSSKDYSNYQPLPSDSPIPSPTSTDIPSPTPDAGHSTVNANPQSIIADGSTTSTVTINLKDNSGNSVPSDTVSIALNSTDPNLKINGSLNSNAQTNADSNMNVPLNTQLTVTFN